MEINYIKILYNTIQYKYGNGGWSEEEEERKKEEEEMVERQQSAAMPMHCT